ncbi:MAG: tyrosine-type recombinase/integrase [Candidatus Sulfotelmatobacter sp.]|jgi:integrase
MFRANIQGRGVLRVREYRTLDVQVLLDDIAASKPLARNTLAHIKHFLSGAFRYAAQAGVREGNPVRECHVPKQRQPAKETHAYDLQEIRTALQVLPTMQRAAVACAAFAGLRRSEVQGLEWSDYDGEDISVNRSVWRGHVEETKTKSSKNYVPAIQALRDILDEYRSTVSVVPIAGARLFKTNLEVMGRKSIKTAMESVGLKWYGWHAFRRGIASNLFELGCDDITVQRVLRHSRVQITQAAYIKIRSPKLDEAMQRLSDAVTRQQIGSK